MSTNTRLDIAIKQLEFARTYMLSLIADIDDADWYRMPAEGTTHIAWQVAHLAMAEYGLCLFRVRGRREVDMQLMPSDFRKKFSRGTQPNPDPNANPSPEQIRSILNRIHDQVRQELPTFTDEQLDEPADPPTAVFETKLGAIYFASNHEMLHAGQIGLLRRLLGKQPIR